VCGETRQGVQQALAQHWVGQLAARMLVGEAWVDRGLVFTHAIGMPIPANHLLQRRFRPLLEQAGLPPIRFHDLRHMAATLMLRGGIHPKVVQEMLGHTSIAMTLDLYSHVMPNMQADAAAMMDHVLGEGDRVAGGRGRGASE
jgi:integrase